MVRPAPHYVDFCAKAELFRKIYVEPVSHIEIQPISGPESVKAWASGVIDRDLNAPRRQNTVFSNIININIIRYIQICLNFCRKIPNTIPREYLPATGDPPGECHQHEVI
jgi:hypothetical protein